jgi:hypothetical protein
MLETIFAWIRFLAPIWIPAVLVGLMWRVWSRPGEFKLSLSEKIARLVIIFVAMLLLAWLFGHFVLMTSRMSWWD